MPLKIYACTCGNSSNLARNVLKKVKDMQWLEFPVVRGKKEVEKDMNSLPDFVKNSPEYKALKSMLSHKSKFVVFFGYSTKFQAVIWTDVASGKIEDKTDAQLIAEKYYNIP